MKTSSIQKFIKAKHFCEVFPVDGTQWFSNGEAAFPLFNFPKMDGKAVKALLSLEDDKAVGWNILIEDSTPTSVCFADEEQPSEEKVDAEDIKIKLRGRIYTAFITSKGAIFINPDYLLPFMKSEDYYSFAVRFTADNSPYLIVRKGMFVHGVIMPENIVNIDLLRKMRYLVNAVYETIENGIAGSENPEIDGQMAIGEA